MRIRTKWNFSQLGILCLALVLAMGTLGISYAAWTDTVTIDTTVNIGNVGTELSCVGCYTDPPDAVDTSISCNVAGNVLEITVTSAQLDVNYYCTFYITNTGDIPVKIQSIVVSGLPGGAVADITGVAEGNQIDPGDTKTGTVYVHLLPEPPENPSEGENFTFYVTIYAVIWNQY